MSEFKMKWRVFPSNRFVLNFKVDTNMADANYVCFETMMFFPLLRFPKLLSWRIARRKEKMECVLGLLWQGKETI